MSDGSRLRQSWYAALNEAEAAFKQLIASPATDWKRLSNSLDGSSTKQKPKAKVPSLPEPTDVLLHRCSTKGGEDVYRMILDVPTGDEPVSLDPWKAVLTTPELRKEWDPAVEDAHLVEVMDHVSRICKTNYTLGWPANPRDSVTISRAFHDTTTLVDITTSLPRSPDEPAYLRPSPPFVRSHVHLFAWCIQYILPQSLPAEAKKPKKGGRLRMTCFWQHDLKALWGFGLSTSALTQQLSTMTVSLFKTVMKRGGRVAKLAGYGNGISIERMRYQIDREAMVLAYAIIPDEDEHHETGLRGMDEVHALREHRRLTRSIECVLPTSEGWDVQVAVKGSSEEVEKIPWSAHAMRNSSTSSATEQVLLRITHGALTDDDAVLKVEVVIEVSGATRGLRLNGLAAKIHDHDDRDPTSQIISQKILQDVASAVDMSIQTSSSSLGSVSTNGSLAGGQTMIHPNTDRTPAAQKSILSKVRRNYIYFSSLLQEPEAKWRRTTEARGVSITQLDSIDPTLVVYRAEATFVGVNLWDLYSTVISPGARVYWDKQHEDDILLEDVNEMTELWHFKTKPAWPVFGRDSVVLKTVYKSPTTIHVFYFSADDPHLFPNIPAADPNVIRTQVDLQGWAIESLSPTTTLLTLLEQSDPKGWTGKTSIPTQMINTVAGIGEFAIKCGGPPIVTRLSGARANELRYDQEKGSLKIEYEHSLKRRLNNSENNSPVEDGGGSLPTIELELRCDLDTWAASLDIVIDPPPQTLSCLRRHRLSTEGGGLWLTLTHDSILMDDERLLAIVRRAPGKEKGLVMVNGTKVSVDVEELPEQEIKSLVRQKRIKPPRIPLDQPPVMGVIRRRKSEWSADDNAKGATSQGGETTDTNANSSTIWASAPKMPSPLARFWTYAVDQATTTTQQAVAAIAPATYSVGTPMLDPTKLPMQYALEALAWAQEFNSKPQANCWTVVYEKGITMHKNLIPEISPYIPVHRGVKVIEGVAAEEIVPVITEYNCRKTWDERYDSASVLESYGGQAQTAFLIAKGGFPFRDRGFFLASVVARPFANQSSPSSSSSRRNTDGGSTPVPSARNTIFCVSASFSPDSAKAFSAEKYNPYSLPIGRVYVDAWILETLDPYTTENYAIPSTRCTRLVAIDYSGSIPAAVNSVINTTMAKGVLAIEAYMKNNVKAALPITRLPAAGLVINDKRPEDHSGAASSTSAGPGSVDGGLVVAAPFMAWKLKKRDGYRVLLESKFDIEKTVYRSSVVVSFPSTNAQREPSSTTITGGAGDARNASRSLPSTTTTPTQSRLALSLSPHGDRQPVGQNYPEVVRKSSGGSMFAQSSAGAASKTVSVMPGSMIPSLDSSSSMTFPNSGLPHISGLPLQSSPPAPFSFVPASPPSLSAFKSASPGRSDSLNSPSQSLIQPPMSPPLPTIRQRAASSGSDILHQSAPPSHGHEGLRGRTVTSGFSGKSEVRQADLVVMEVVIDSKMFRSGRYLYAVDVKGRKRQKSEGLKAGAILVGDEGEVTEKGNGNSSTNPTLLPSSSSALGYLHLPFGYALHTMPSSPLHSSGLSSETPSRHLLRVTLPTAQYLVNSFWDPLTGEMRDPPPKPEWMKILEGGDQEQYGGIVVDVVVHPLEEKEGASKKLNKERFRQIVLINGKEVGVVGEKESLSSVGREELLDDRVAKMGVLSRIPNESEPLPEELKIPVGIAEGLLLPVLSTTSGPNIQGPLRSAEDTGIDDESVNGIRHGTDAQISPKMEVGLTESGISAGNGSLGETHATHAATTGLNSGGMAGGGGFFGFLQTYPNPFLTRLGFSGADGVTIRLGDGDRDSRLGEVNILEGEKEKDKTMSKEEGAISAVSSNASDSDVTDVTVAITDEASPSVVNGYQLSTLVFVGLIAFLIGSLLRSLLSPADFVYVVSDVDAQHEANGWREIRRLFEIEYLIGGWDFQIAIVRRH